LKQSATDPLSGKIDVGILTTGLSSAARKRRVELAQALKKLIASKERVVTLNYQKIFTEFKETSQLVSHFFGIDQYSYILWVVRIQFLLIFDHINHAHGDLCLPVPHWDAVCPASTLLLLLPILFIVVFSAQHHR
jgi:hypothetical protein